MLFLILSKQSNVDTDVMEFKKAVINLNESNLKESHTHNQTHTNSYQNNATITEI